MLLPSHSRPSILAFAVTLSILAVGVGSSIYVYTQVDRTSRIHAIERADTLAQALSASDVQTLTGTEADLASPAYQGLKELLMREHAVNHGVRFIYLIGRDTDGSLFFFMDSEDPNSPDYSPPGQSYPEATPLMYQFFTEGKSVSEGPDRDRWGVWISAYAPVRDAHGNLIAMLGMDLPAGQYISDIAVYAMLPLLVTLITLLILAAEGARRRRHVQALEQKAEFLSVASHQIRTPLTGIRWAVERILNSPKSTLDPKDRDVLSLVHDSSLGLLTRVNNLLDVAAVEQRGSIVLHKEPLHVRTLIEDIVSSLTLSAKRRDVSLIIDESVHTDLVIDGDRQTTYHIFFNLIGNAVKYTREHTEVRIAYGWTPEGHMFTVTDHGPGIAASEHEQIFEGYHRTKQAATSGESGSGLGLYLTKQLLTLTGGTIELVSVMGEGSVFSVTLPD